MDEKKKQIRNIALAAAGIVVLYWGLNHLELLKTGAGKVIGILSPFLVGLCIAYVLSVPMRGFEKLLFRPNKKTRKVRFEKFKAPVSLTLSILAVLLVLSGGLLLWLSPLSLVCGLLAALGYRRMARKQFGGVTGDTSGFFLQVCELAMLAGLWLGGFL